MKDHVGLGPHPTFPAFKLTLLTSNNNPARSLPQLRRTLGTQGFWALRAEGSETRRVRVSGGLNLLFLEA